MTKKEIKKFFDTHRCFDISPAKSEYLTHYFKGIGDIVFNALEERNASLEESEISTRISNADDGEQLVALMRKEILGKDKYNLRKKLIANEDLVMSLIKEKSLTNRQNTFIENALYFFLNCEENVSNWIVSNYESFKSEYLKSMFCLVLGFRGEEELIPFLISEAERFEKYYPNETYDQGPALAVSELVHRCLHF